MTPGVVPSLIERGFAAHKAHKFVDAIALYEVALSRDPENVDALNLCASAYRSSGDLTRAMALLQRAVAKAPKRSDVLFNWGNALTAAGRFAEAVAAYAAAREGDPGNAEILANIGIAHGKAAEFPEAIAAYRAAIEIEPRHRTARHNLGNALGEAGDFNGAIEVLSSLIAEEPGFAEAHYNLSYQLLRQGDYGLGFAEYEWRWRTPGFPSERRHEAIPDWDGRPFRERTLLIHAEQGLGDSLQFLRFLPMVKSLGGTVVLQVPRSLIRLASQSGADRVVADDRDIGPADLQVPLMGVPHRLRLTLGSIGMRRPYLAADPALVSRWSDRLKLASGPRSVGLVWRGNPAAPVDRGRSLPSAEALAPLAAIEGIRLIALQKLPPDELEPAEVPSGWKVKGLSFTIEHPGPDFDAGQHAFLDSAAVMAGLALVVSTCTAPLHLAGALGRPTLALLKRVPDWRWLVDREDSPWYPSLRLLRQKETGPLGPVVGDAVPVIRRMIETPVSGAW